MDPMGLEGRGLHLKNYQPSLTLKAMGSLVLGSVVVFLFSKFRWKTSELQRVFLNKLNIRTSCFTQL